LAASFGILADEAGFSPLAAVIFSAIVFAGSAQFASVSIIAAGGTAGAAVAAATLMNSRFLPMSAAAGPSFTGGPLKRAAKGQAVVDASWAMSSRGDGSFDQYLLLGASAIAYLSWVTGTAVGALVLVPITPPGVPVLAASLASLVGLTKRARAEALERQEAEGEPR